MIFNLQNSFKKRPSIKLSFVFFLILGAAALIQAATDEPVYTEYFTISQSDDPFLQDFRTPEMNPVTYFKEGLGSDLENEFSASVLAIPDKELFLLKFDHHNGSFGQTQEPYNRQAQYGGWSRDRRTPDCFNTRAKVLMRDSSVPVEFRDSSCSVASGRWQDPYTGQEFFDTKDIQIDHFVPLKNSYISGGWKWDFQKRCLYANFLGNPYHLLAVSGRENMRKSDKGPDGYMPPDSNYSCNYLKQWLKLKMIWALGLTPPEVSKIRQLVQQNHCSSADLEISSEELATQRAFIQENMNLCRQRKVAN